jgi:hypothetical protein
MAYNFQIGINKTNIYTEYEILTQIVLYADDVLSTLMYRKNMPSYFKMTIVREKAMCVPGFFETNAVMKTQRRYRTQHGKDPPLYNALRRWVKQFQETVGVLNRKGAGRPNN